MQDPAFNFYYPFNNLAHANPKTFPTVDMDFYNVKIMSLQK